ncbi:MAG: YicC family protein [Bauldia sp.]|nr:YicC family protein [Bauldia sp.]
MSPAPAIQSMTGFARAEGSAFGLRWTWELRSVNGKSLDLRFRGPPGTDQLEPFLRERVAAKIVRGSIQANLTVQREGNASSVRIDRAALAELVAVARELGQAEPAIDRLLAIRGIVEIVEGDPEPPAGLNEALLATFDLAVADLAAVRHSEGVAIAKVLSARIDRIEALAAEAERHPSRTAEAIRLRLSEQVAALLGATAALDRDRLHQEAMLLAARADIREELDRLVAHVAAARGLLAEGGAVGRRLDFLAQEFNRESNTLCAKANDRGLTAIGLELKATVDQFREQVQNLE